MQSQGGWGIRILEDAAILRERRRSALQGEGGMRDSRRIEGGRCDEYVVVLSGRGKMGNAGQPIEHERSLP